MNVKGQFTMLSTAVVIIVFLFADEVFKAHWLGFFSYNYRFKGIGIIDASPETCFKYCDPKPDGRRVKWDKAIKELEVIEYLKKDDPVGFQLSSSKPTCFPFLLENRFWSNMANFSLELFLEKILLSASLLSIGASDWITYRFRSFGI